MSSNTKQLVLIGDYKQLRPKVNNYSLTVDKATGYNLDVSLFERLVNAGVPHTTLNLQHRMRPEISTLVRSLTYPGLEDAPRTAGRQALRGFQDNVIFVSHDVPEVNADSIADRRDGGAKTSKENAYEVDMVLKCVRYLGQQGYGTDQIVVLTPYLGQLHRLIRSFLEENDPVLNDLDSFELIRAGLVSPAGANITKRKLRISTIDNYQGEESDIVIATLTRSNSIGDIGFMKSPQRVNVLLSRARNSLIMIGNAETFMSSHKGKDVWVPLLEQLKREGHVYDGFPVQCEQHPDRKACLTTKESFDEKCPDGGCSEPCGKMLSCNIHKCPQRCHQLQDHSKMACRAIVKTTCSAKHVTSHECQSKNSRTCSRCEAEALAKERKRKRDHRLDQERQARQRAYAAKLAELDDEMEHQKRLMKDQTEDSERRNVLTQKKIDLANMRESARKAKETASATSNTSSLQTQSNQSAQSNEATVNQDSKDNNATCKQPTRKDTNSRSPAPKEALPDWDRSDAKDDWKWIRSMKTQTMKR